MEAGRKEEKYKIKGRIKQRRELKYMSNHLEAKSEKISKSTEKVVSKRKPSTK